MILLYHNLVPDSAPAGYKLSSITLRQSVFEKHIAWLSQYFEIVSLDVYLSLETNNEKRHGRKIAITFDDGTATSFACAFSILQKYIAPATFFVTTCHIDYGPLMPGCYLNAVCFEEIYSKIEVGGTQIPLNTSSERKQARSLVGMMAKESENPLQFVRKLEEIYPLPSDVQPFYQGMSREQMKIAGNSELIEIGAHSVTHPDLSRIPVESQRWEIRESRRVLEELTEKPVKYFAYPSGQYVRNTIELVEDAGYKAAFATIPKYLGDQPIFELERFGIYSPSVIKLMLKTMGIANIMRRFGAKVG